MCITYINVLMDVLCELYPVEMTAIFASKRIFAAAATGGARTAELPINNNNVGGVVGGSDGRGQPEQLLCGQRQPHSATTDAQG